MSRFPPILDPLTPKQALFIRENWEYESFFEMSKELAMTPNVVKRYGLEHLGLLMQDYRKASLESRGRPRKSHQREPFMGMKERLARPIFFDEGDMTKRLVAGR